MALRQKRDSFDFTDVTDQRQEFIAGACVPYLDDAVATRGGEQCPIGAESCDSDRGGVSPQPAAAQDWIVIEDSKQDPAVALPCRQRRS